MLTTTWQQPGRRHLAATMVLTTTWQQPGCSQPLGSNYGAHNHLAATRVLTTTWQQLQCSQPLGSNCGAHSHSAATALASTWQLQRCSQPVLVIVLSRLQRRDGGICVFSETQYYHAMTRMINIASASAAGCAALPWRGLCGSDESYMDMAAKTKCMK